MLYQYALDLLEPVDGGLICGTVKPSSLHLLLLALKFEASFVSLTPTIPNTSEGYTGDVA